MMAVRIRRHLDIQGIVQGVGFRPFVWQTATRLGLDGWVRNTGLGAEIEIEGRADVIDDFMAALKSELPSIAKIESCEMRLMELRNDSGFQIVETSDDNSPLVAIPPDLAMCSDCARELLTPSDRRFEYPFVNCTHCGPRYTIITDLPYDRNATTMQPFAMCAACLAEYSDPSNRRFHAQPNACPNCGPKIGWHSAESDGSPSDAVLFEPTPQILMRFRDAIKANRIVAVKGIGGFHLVADATSDSAVQRLRERKGRNAKPFAIMVNDLDMARRLASLSQEDERLLSSKEGPIVLVRKKADCGMFLSSRVAPDNRYLGMMLPYSPLHQLLVTSVKVPLVMTSGNLSEEPIAYENEDAFNRLRGLCDCFLVHDRPIQTVCDDSVVRCVGDGAYPIRRARGYTPLPIRIPDSNRCSLAVGGEMKSTCCVASGPFAYVSQHIGDMGNLSTLNAMDRAATNLLRLIRKKPNRIVCDLHPDYLSTRWAEQQSESLGVPLLRVQHHHAHLASLAAEYRLQPTQPLVGFVFDGTGYGTDQTIWGGEMLHMQGTRMERIAHLQYFQLPGGDSAVRHPVRCALSLLDHAGIPWNMSLDSAKSADQRTLALLRQQLDRSLNCVPTSSIGRLFDGVASLLGIRHTISYEAQAAMELEAMAEDFQCSVQEGDSNYPSLSYTIDWNARPIQFSANQLLQEIVRCLLGGSEAGALAFAFHVATVKLIVELSQFARREFGLDQIGLTGGVFQNLVLLKMAKKQLELEGFEVLTHRCVPPNDGGISLGQAWLANLQD